MFFQEGRLIVVWLTWLIGGLCGVFALLVIICYCRLMPRHQKSFDEQQYVKDTYTTKDTKSYSQDGYRVKHAEVQVHRHNRPVSYGGPVHAGTNRYPETPTETHKQYEPRTSTSTQYASSSILDALENESNMEALKTRSLPAFLRPPRPRPLSTEDDLQQLYAKVNLSKKYKNRMRNEHAAIIAMSKSQSQYLNADAVIVYDQRTAL